jgi:ribokinase
MVGAVGEDAFAREATVGLEEAGVGLSDLRVVDASTGVALIVVDASGENQIVVAPGANGRLGADDVGADASDGVIAQLEIPLAAVDAASRLDAFFCLNAAPARPVPPELLERVDVLVVNRYELDALGRPPRALTALTLGAEGAVLLEDGAEVARARPPRVDAVDGTAAGDAFTACLVVSLLEGRAREEALRRACAAGALAASRFGAQPSLPTAEEVDAILAAA